MATQTIELTTDWKLIIDSGFLGQKETKNTIEIHNGNTLPIGDVPNLLLSFLCNIILIKKTRK